MLAITALYAGLNACILVALTVRVIGGRRAAGVSLGHGDDKALERRMRGHGNATETIPIALILIALIEMLAAPALVVHALGLMLTVGRLSHARAFWSDTPKPFYRVFGMALTLSMLALGAVGLTILALVRLL
ncbi:MAG: MAPEG family protein [Pseudomonadota bacterium]